MKILKYIPVIILLILVMNVHSQDNRFIKEDSLKTKYPYTLPIFGHFLHDIGVDLPYPVGIMANYYYGIQPITITDIAVGFSDGLLPEVPVTDISRLIEFEDVTATVHSFTIRPDVWLLPFLSVYGLIGKTWTKTNVKISYPFELNTQADLDGMSYGLGMTLAGGYRGFFGVFDVNRVWTDMKNFENPVATSVLSVRAGYAFDVGKKSESNLGFWLGAMQVNMGNTTTGSIKLNEVLPPETAEKLDEIVENYYTWYNSIDPNKQEIADKTITPIVENLAQANGEGTVKYSINKIPAQKWNMLVGAQYQINKHFQVRAEAGFIGRESFLISYNYRFGIKHKN
jgi:hypothetical protein